MEAASVAWAASFTGTPFVGLKVVTDIVDGDRPSHEEFMENLAAAALKLHEVLPKITSYVLGKRLSEL
jgi:5'-methylthioadenosine nucleosidase